jgi:ribosomal protein S20
MTIRSGIGANAEEQNKAANAQLKSIIKEIERRTKEYLLNGVEEVYQEAYAEVEPIATKVTLQNEDIEKTKEIELDIKLKIERTTDSVSCEIHAKNNIENAVLLTSSHGTAMTMPEKILDFCEVKEEKIQDADKQNTKFSKWYFTGTLLHIKFPHAVYMKFKDLLHG